MSTSFHRLVAILGAIVGGLAGWLLGTPVVGFALLQIFAIGGWLIVRYRSWIPERGDWKTRRWNGLLVVVITSGAIVAQNNLIEKTLTEGIALALLVFGVGYTSFLLGVVMAREEIDESSETAVKTELVD